MGAQVGGAVLSKQLSSRLPSGVERACGSSVPSTPGWDYHGTNPKEDIRDGLTKKCTTMDKPISALINDLDAGLF